MSLSTNIHVDILCVFEGDSAQPWWSNLRLTSRVRSEPFLFKGKGNMEIKCHTNLSLIWSKSALRNILLVILSGQRVWPAVGFVWHPLPLWGHKQHTSDFLLETTPSSLCVSATPEATPQPQALHVTHPCLGDRVRRKARHQTQVWSVKPGTLLGSLGKGNCELRGWESGTEVSHLTAIEPQPAPEWSQSKKQQRWAWERETDTEPLNLETPLIRATPEVLVIWTNKILFFLLSQPKIGVCCLQPRILRQLCAQN